MEIYVRGEDIRVSELKEKLGDQYRYTIFNNIDETSFDNAGVVFDLNLDDCPQDTFKYNSLNLLLIAGSLKCGLLSLAKGFQKKVHMFFAIFLNFLKNSILYGILLFFYHI